MQNRPRRRIRGLREHAVSLKVVILVASILASLGVAMAAPLTLTLIHVNDWDRMDGVDNAGGAARIATVAAEERTRAEAKGGLAIVTFGGDMISPSLLSGIDQGAHMIKLADSIGFDVAVLGNHEFDFGPDVLRERLAESKTTWLAGNVSVAGRPGFPGAAATTMVEKDGYQIGFLGLVTPETSVISKAGPDVSFDSVTETGARLADALKAAGADVVIALTHLELSTDLELLRTVEAIDVVLGGHDHLLIARHDGRQAVMKAGSQGRHVGVLNLSMDRVVKQDGALETVWKPEFRLRSTAGLEGDATISAMVRDYQAHLDKTLDVVIGESATELDTRRLSVRSGETAFGNLLADAMRAATESQIALYNGGGIRGDTVYPPGTKISRKIVLAELPFGNKMVMLRLTGAQVKQMLETGVSQIEQVGGRFPHVSGLAFSFDVRKPVGARVTSVSVGGAALQDDRSYTVATGDFLALGGDGYTVFGESETLIDSTSGGLVASHLINYIVAVGTVSPRVEGRIRRED